LGGPPRVVVATPELGPKLADQLLQARDGLPPSAREAPSRLPEGRHELELEKRLHDGPVVDPTKRSGSALGQRNLKRAPVGGSALALHETEPLERPHHDADHRSADTKPLPKRALQRHKRAATP